MRSRSLALVGLTALALVASAFPVVMPRLSVVSVSIAPIVAAMVLASLAGALPALAAARVENAGDVLVVHDDGTILTPPEPLPLAGRRLRFVPAMRGGYATQLASISTPSTRAAAAYI